MKDSFERDLKQKLEQATPEELGFRPDRDKLWGKINAQPKTKTVPLRTWITHAAAIAAGLLIGAFFLNRDQQPAVATGTPPLSSSQKVKIKTDTVYVLQPAREHKDQKTTAQAPVVTETRQHQEPNLPTVPQEQIAQNKETPAPATLPGEITVATNKQLPKVLHLSDMGNENTDTKLRTTQNLAFFKILSNQNQTGDNQHTFSMLVKRRFIPAKN